MGRIISFRGLAESEDTIRLSLSTNDGKTGYKIRKFELFPHKPGTQDAEDVMKLYKTQFHIGQVIILRIGDFV